MPSEKVVTKNICGLRNQKSIQYYIFPLIEPKIAYRLSISSLMKQNLDFLLIARKLISFLLDLVKVSCAALKYVG